MSSDEVLDSCRQLFHQHDCSMRAVAELLRRARDLTAQSQDRLDSSVESSDDSAQSARKARWRKVAR